MIRVLLADDHPMVREGLARILEESPDIGVVGHVADASDLLARVEELEPDIVLLDISMPGPGFLETLRALRDSDCSILVLSMYPEEQFGVRALRAGAAGYLTKERSPTELIGAIHRVHGGERYVSAELADRLATRSAGEDRRQPHERLSEREFQVLQMLGEGRTVGEISGELSLSPKTISTYRTRVIKKLGLRTTSELVRYAVENELTGRPSGVGSRSARS